MKPITPITTLLMCFLTSIASHAQNTLIDGCYRKSYNVDPSGHLAKIPEGVDWIFSFKGSNSELKVTAAGRPEYCHIPFELTNIKGAPDKFQFSQLNKTQTSEWGICATMAEFQDEKQIEWSGYAMSAANSIRLRFVGFNNKTNTSDWTKIPCRN